MFALTSIFLSDLSVLHLVGNPYVIKFHWADLAMTRSKTWRPSVFVRPCVLVRSCDGFPRVYWIDFRICASWTLRKQSPTYQCVYCVCVCACVSEWVCHPLWTCLHFRVSGANPHLWTKDNHTPSVQVQRYTNAHKCAHYSPTCLALRDFLGTSANTIHVVPTRWFTLLLVRYLNRGRREIRR